MLGHSIERRGIEIMKRSLYGILIQLSRFEMLLLFFFSVLGCTDSVPVLTVRDSTLTANQGNRPGAGEKVTIVSLGALSSYYSQGENVSGAVQVVVQLNGTNQNEIHYTDSGSCKWLNVDQGTGIISGSPTDDDVGPCEFSIVAEVGSVVSQAFTLDIEIHNVLPSLSVADELFFDRNLVGAQVIAEADDVSSDEEDFGSYSIGPADEERCDDLNAGEFAIDPDSGEITFTPTSDFIALNKTCKILVSFDDENGGVSKKEVTISQRPALVASGQAAGAISLNAGESKDVPLPFSVYGDVQALSCGVEKNQTADDFTLENCSCNDSECTVKIIAGADASGEFSFSYQIFGAQDVKSNSANFAFTINASLPLAIGQDFLSLIMTIDAQSNKEFSFTYTGADTSNDVTCSVESKAAAHPRISLKSCKCQLGECRFTLSAGNIGFITLSEPIYIEIQNGLKKASVTKSVTIYGLNN